MFIFRVLFDIATIFTLCYFGVYMDLYWQPVQRGFDCGDVTLNYRKYENTVSPTACVAGGVFIPMAIILLFDIVIYRRKASAIYTNIMTFQVGVSLVFVTCNFIKYNVGMLRPYFLTICKPDYEKLDCSYGYVADPMCTGDENELKWARLTFPSLHSSITSYGASYLIVFLYQKYNNTGRVHIINISAAILQCVYITWYIYVAMTRVLDHRHHMTDVIAGTVWGLVFAFLMVTLPRVATYVTRTRQNESVYIHGRADYTMFWFTYTTVSLHRRRGCIAPDTIT